MHLLFSMVMSLLGLQPTADAGAARDTLTIDLGSDEPRRWAGMPTVSGSRNPARPLVVIDPGHGGRDPGAISPFAARREKDVTLALARAIRAALEKSGRVRIALTRDDDRFLVLRDRYEIARRLGADLFISVHADASPSNDAARGATIYTLSEVASDREAALIARQQNASDRIGGARLSEDQGVNRILIDLAQRDSMDVSAGFASLVGRESGFPMQEDFHRFAALVVLKAPDIPSVLFESGYLTNASDAAYIDSAEGRGAIAAGLTRAIETHFARRLIGGR